MTDLGIPLWLNLSHCACMNLMPCSALAGKSSFLRLELTLSSSISVTQ